ncbi:MAG: glycosyltransferase family 4 protein [Mycoplasmoidaceae bacterium]
MKKILIISWGLLPNIGGVEKYIDNLIKLFIDRNFAIDIFVTDFTDLKTRKKYNEYYPNINIIFGNNKDLRNRILKNKFYNLFEWLFGILKTRFVFNKFFNNINYDLIIDNTILNFSKLRKNKKSLWIIHTNLSNIINQKLSSYKIYDIKKILGFIIFQKIFKINESFKYYSNIVVFSEKDKLILEDNKNIKKWQKIFHCFCSIKNHELDSTYNSKGNIVSILRYEDGQKNLKFMDELSKNLDNPINVYGEGKDKHLFQNTIVHDKITDENLKYNILSKSSLFIMTSNSTEGLPFSIVEALSVGLPIVIRDTFLHARTLVKDKYNGLVFNEDVTPTEVANEIKNLLKNQKLLKEMSQNSIKIFNENFEISNFNKSWENIIKQIVNK